MNMERTLIQHIEIRKNRAGHDRAFVAGTRVRVQDIYGDSEVLGKSPEEIVAALPHLSMAQVYAHCRITSITATTFSTNCAKMNSLQP